MRGPRDFSFGNQETSADHGNIEKAAQIPGIWEIQRFTKAKTVWGRGELWRELFGHQGADGALIVYDETQNPVLATQSWLSIRVVNMPLRPLKYVS